MPGDLEERKPAASGKSDTTRNFSFAVKWKNSRPSNENAFFTDAGYFHAQENCDWITVKNQLMENGAIRVTYFDAEGDEIPIESQCEFTEFLKYFRKNSDTHIVVEKLETLREADDSEAGAEILEQEENADSLQERQTKMAPKELNAGQSDRTAASYPSQFDRHQTQRQTMASSVLDFTEFGRNSTHSQVRAHGIQTENSGDTAPKWFTNYMQTMKDEMVVEISQRVTTIVMDALTKKRESQYDSASSRPRASDSEYLLDSDSEDRVILADQAQSYITKNREKKVALDGPRRSYRHSQEKQRKKRTKSHSVNHPPNPDEIWHSPSFNRRRGEKTVRNKREFEEARALPQNASRSELPLGKSVAGSEEFLGEEVATSPYRRTFSSGMKRSSSTPAPSADVLEAPILKLRIANPYNEMPNEPEEKVRMGCSVTGQDLLERPNDRVPEYFALSDSDNISIISDVSENSEKLRRANGFEMVPPGSSMFTDEVDDDVARIIITDLQLPREPEDPENARDSSSFELLSEPPASPPLSIHMDEDHFATAINETSNYNINDETTFDKRGNQSKIDKVPYAIDAHGKIYQQNIMDGEEECAEIVLEKRTGGAYSFVGETLPAPTKEEVVPPENSESTADRTAFTLADDELTQATEDPDRFVYHDFYDSTQSFHSHTAQQAENNRQDSSATTAAASPPEETSRSHVFTDHNASKGLGDTKRSSPKKQTPAGDKSSEDSCRSERSRSSRRSSQDPHGSGNRNSGSRHDPRTRRFANWSTMRNTRMVDDLVFNAVDPMHILPETLVTGAVHVASSAYTTARRVYDKILTAQMRKPADRSQSKFGRR